MNHNNLVAASSSRLAIKTLAFFDLETTGLPDLEFFKTKITELSIVACSVNHFLDVQDNESPRVLHKITICLNPYKRIDLKASEVTGLTNELLEHENKFDKNAMNLLECFIFQLQQPVCLIAHNGNEFDFPLLKKQCNVLEGTFPFTLKCCDSLNVFKKYHDMMQRKINLLGNNLQQWNDVHEDGLMNAEIEHLLEDFSKRQNDENGIDEIFDVLVKNEIDVIEKAEQENQKAEQDDSIMQLQKINETTPNKPTKASNIHPRTNGIPNTQKRPNTSRRELFPSTSSPHQKGQFSLREIYKRFYQNYPEHSHDSESDVMSLLKCAVACKNDFIKIVNESAINFMDVKPF